MSKAPRFFKACGMVLLFVFFPGIAAAQFTAGNLVVLQANNGVATQTNTGNPIVLREFSTSGAPNYSMAVPVTGSAALVMSGSAGSEGYLSLSADNRYLVFGGYVQSLPNTTPLPGSTASTINRGIGMVSGTGSYSLVAASASFFSTGNIRGAAAINNTRCWGSGSSQGTNYFGPVAPLTVQNTKTNLRAVNIFNNQLYCSAQVASGTPTDIGIYKIGTGTPTVAGQTASCVIVTGTGSQPGQFFFNNTGTVCYVADSRNSALGGVQKWVYSTGSWTLAYTLPTGTAAIGAFGVVADFSGTAPKVYATTSESGNNRLVAISDIGPTATATTIATASTAHTHFRGLAFAPCTAPQVTITGNNNPCTGQALALQATAISATPVSYTWSGPGANSSTLATLNTANPATAIYTLYAGNSCGVSSPTIAVTVNLLPVVYAGSITVCTGQPATLTAGGASSYTWNTGSTSATMVVTPPASTVYTVTGVSAAGCAGTATVPVVTATTPTLTLHTTPYCSGSSATLTAGGANSYTWSTGVSSNSIVVAPSSAASYTVSGSLTGCAGVSTSVTSVSVLPSPVVTITGGTITCAGTPISLQASGADTYLWSTNDVMTAILMSPAATTVYSVTGASNNGCTGSASHTVNIGSGPVLSGAQSSSILCVFLTDVTFTVSGATTYSWSNGMTGPVITVSPTTVGVKTYTVKGYLGPNCFSSKEFSLRAATCAALHESIEGGVFSIFPNPAGSSVKITFESIDERTVQIINLPGQIVYNKSIYDQQVSLDLGTLSKGIYYIKVSYKGGSSTKKLLIE